MASHREHGTANKHGIVVLRHAMRFCVQWVARVTQQVHDADIYLPKFEILMRVAISTEGIGTDEGSPFPLRSLVRCH